MEKAIIEFKGISKHFPGIKALDEVDLSVYPGEIHALIGENGAGKSTLVKIMTGVYAPTGGLMLLRGEPVQFSSALDAQKAGITAIHQEASMFPELSVTENIYMGHHLKSRGGLAWKQMRRRTRELLDTMELDINPDALVKNLSTAQRHMVEIAKALSIEAEVVIMDEPTSALTLREVEDLYKIIRRLKDQGKAILFISHKFDEIFEICDTYTVFRDGRYIGHGRIEDTNVDNIVSMMVGRSLDQMFPKTPAEIGETVLEVRNLCRDGQFHDVCFSLRKGEILGFFGLVGAGRTEVMRVLFGIEGKTGGQVLLNGQACHIKKPRDAMDLGMAFIPEDRQEQGAIQKMSISHNITLAKIDDISPLGVLRRQPQEELTHEYGSLMEIKAAGWNVNANTLSGGNQQKVVIAKWLATQPRILIMDEPTKGIDVATKAAVHSFVSQMAARGLAVILVSSELPEILGMADRIIVMHEGQVTASFERDEADSEKIIRAATGHTQEVTA